MSGKVMKRLRRISKCTGGGQKTLFSNGQIIWTDRPHRFYAFLKKTGWKRGLEK